MGERSGERLEEEEDGGRDGGGKGKGLCRARSSCLGSVEKKIKTKEEELGEEDEEEEAVMVPEDFICSLSSTVMEDPVVVASGQTFERRSIQAWLDSGHRSCPKTHQPLLNPQLIPNHTLKALIRNWLRAHGVSFPLTAAKEQKEEQEVSSYSSDSGSLDRPPLADELSLGLNSPESSITYESSFDPLVIDNIVEDLNSSHADIQQRAASELRILAKCDQNFRYLIADAGAVRPLITLLNSKNLVTQELAVTTLLNLSLNDSLKPHIAASGAIEPLVMVLRIGSPRSKQNAAFTLSSLSSIDELKDQIGAAGAVPPLLTLLADGSIRGKKDAATALYSLSSLERNKQRIVKAGALKLLLELIRDSSSGMVDKAIAILSNLVTFQEGRASLVQEGGVSVLVQAMEAAGSSKRRKDLAISVLLRLCSNSSQHWWAGLMQQEGAISVLEAISKSSGNGRAKGKAHALLRKLRERRPHISGEIAQV